MFDQSIDYVSVFHWNRIEEHWALYNLVDQWQHKDILLISIIMS